MPRKAFTVPSDFPWSLPVSMLTCGAEPAPRNAFAANSTNPNIAINPSDDPSLLMPSPPNARGTIPWERVGRKSGWRSEQQGRRERLDLAPLPCGGYRYLRRTCPENVPVDVVWRGD